jgi:kinesin family member 2/24
MEAFYLANVARYQDLIETQKADISRANETESAKVSASSDDSDIIVSARIRPLLADDIAAGFPRAIYVRPYEPEILDIHDLYNYPWGKPILKVRSPSWGP